MQIPALLLVLLLLAVFASGFGLGHYVSLDRTRSQNDEDSSHHRAELGLAQADATRWQAAAAEATGRADVLERENVELSQRARNEQALLRMIEPLSARLKDMTERVASMQAKQAAQDAAVREQLSATASAHRELARETTSLRAALTSVSSRGTWGEVELRRIVESAGMLKHTDFSEQQNVATTNGAGASAARPDMTVHLPGGAHIAVDAKVPLTALLKAQEIEGTDQFSEARRSELVAEHARAVRAHVKELAKRDYPAEFPGSPRITVMFLPTESLLSQALADDPTILEDALKSGVAPATPSSLLALLRSVAAVWSSARVTEEAQEILALGRTLVKRIGTVANHVDKLGGSLRSAVSNYNKTIASLNSRLIQTASQFESIETSIETPQTLDGESAHVRSFTAAEIIDELED